MIITTNYQGQLAEQLSQYRTKGHKEATANRPATNATRPDQHEAALRSEAEKWQTSERRLFGRSLDESNRALVDTAQKVVELATKVDQIRADDSLTGSVEQDLAAARPAVVSAIEDRMRAEVECRYFKAAHGIVEQAVYPESRVFHMAIIAVLALLEVGVNAFFYENDQGLLGGLVVALAVSVFTIGTSTTLGYGFRFKNLGTLDCKVVGWCCFMGFVLVAVYCNALFAAFRTEYQDVADPSNFHQLRDAFAAAAAEAKEVFYLRMHVKDFMSFVLFGLGLLLGALAFYKGYTLDDRYPGYGAKDRRFKAAQKIESLQLEIVRGKIREVAQLRRAEVQAAIHEYAQLIGRTARQASDLKQAHSLLMIQGEAIRRDFNLVLRTYRKANEAVRATEPPEYFKSSSDDLLGLVSDADPQPLLDKLDALQQQISVARSANQDSLNAKLKTLQETTSTLLTRTLDEFVHNAEKDAEQRLDRLATTFDLRVQASA